MKTVYLKVWDKCNLRCKHCFIRELDNPKLQDIDSVCRFIKTVEKVDKNINVLLFGGEPLIAPEDYLHKLIDGLEQLKAKNDYLTVSMTTNLTMELTETRLAILERLDGYGTSYDHGDTRFTTDALKKKWESNLRFIKDRYDKDMGIITTFSNALIQSEPKDILTYFNSLPISSIMFEKIVETEGTFTGRYYSPDYDKVDEWFSKLVELYLTGDYKFKIRNPLSDLLDKNPSSCCYECTDSMITLQLNGDVCECPSTYDVIGNLNQSYEDIFRSMALNKLRANRFKRLSICGSCKYLPMCKFGSCYKLANRVNESGSTVCPGYPKTIDTILRLSR
ncbi:hypothetical protein C3I27_03540 [Campylobacter jejuni]|uniref:Radical SAM core domain-containing protein n=1 Tax=Campylobacter jejuni TaxID=197 RepID=A0AAX1Z4N7_CAMJU|nr:hypothetical protein C3I27_03540 [Campylobacter jejuni]